MKTKYTRLGGALLASLALGLTTTAAASAHEFLIEGAPVTTPTKVEGVGGVFTLVSKSGPTEIIVECTKNTLKGTIEAAGKSGNTLTFAGCTVTKPKACKIVEPLKFNTVNKLLGEPVAYEFGPEGESKRLFNIIYTDCSLEGSYPITGSFTCELPNVTVSAVTHEIVCTPSGSHAAWGSGTATLRVTETVKLVSGQLWSAH